MSQEHILVRQKKNGKPLRILKQDINPELHDFPFEQEEEVVDPIDPNLEPDGNQDTELGAQASTGSENPDEELFELLKKKGWQKLNSKEKKIYQELKAKLTK